MTLPLSNRRALLASAISMLSPAAFAQGAPAYPTRAVRLITPFSPGGATDVLSRIISEKMAIPAAAASFVRLVSPYPFGQPFSNGFPLIRSFTHSRYMGAETPGVEK